jgi:hypothetical protein
VAVGGGWVRGKHLIFFIFCKINFRCPKSHRVQTLECSSAGAFLTLLRPETEPPCQIFFKNLIFKPAMGSCIKKNLEAIKISLNLGSKGKVTLFAPMFAPSMQNRNLLNPLHTKSKSSELSPLLCARKIK